MTLSIKYWKKTIDLRIQRRLQLPIGSLANTKSLRDISYILLILICIATNLASQNLEVAGKAIISKMDTASYLGANVVREADGTLSIRHFRVGDYAHGGVVFWIDESGEHGLVCDTTDIRILSWDEGESRRTFSHRDGIWGGEANTLLILAQQANDTIEGLSAASLCSLTNTGGYGDWYLPSRSELELMFINSDKITSTSIAMGGSGFQNHYYWSSTETRFDTAWAIYFVDGNQINFTKGSLLPSRAIRAF